MSIGPPDLTLLSSIRVDPDVRYPLEHWVSEAKRREDILYFSIFLDEEPMGQILLQDINLDRRESLIAYHLFWLRVRGQGFGTQALRLLQSCVLQQTTLKKLLVITSRDNIASQRIAQKCQFQFMRPSREDPVNGIVFEWQVPRRS